MGKSISYAELDALTRDFAAWLHANGLGKGDRIALMMPNLLQYPVCLFGAWRAGCVVVNCNPLYTAHELEHQLADSGARAIVVADNFAATLQQALPKSAIERVLVTSIGELLGPLKGRLVDLVVKRVKRMVPAWSIPGAQRLGQALRAGRALPFTEVELNQDDLACLQYTGGTTGVVKAAMLSHGNLMANVSQAHAWVTPLVRDGEELIVTALPLYHIFALTANCLTFMKIGASNLLIVNPRDIPGLIKEMSKAPVSAFTGVNTLFNALLNNPDFAKLDFAPAPDAGRRHGGAAFGGRALARRHRPLAGPGLRPDRDLARRDHQSAGREGIHRLHRPAGAVHRHLHPRRRGPRTAHRRARRDLRARPPGDARLLEAPDETALVLYADGFLRTGDIGYVDEAGYVFLVDRKRT